MRRTLIMTLSLLLVGWFAPVHADAPRDPYKHFFNESWGNFHEELATAKQQGKQGILIFFEMHECPFCHYMKENVLNQPEVQAYYRKHFLNFSVDIEGDVDITDFKGHQMKQKDFAFKEYRVRATPVIAFFDLNGKLVQRYTGKTDGVHEFMLLGKYVANGVYKKMPFIRYKREQRSAENDY